VTNLAEAAGVLARTQRAAALVASGLDGKTCVETVRWFARLGHGIVVAMLEYCDDRHRQEALEAGASHVCSKPELLVAQLRYELAARLEGAAPEPRRCWG
jgi:CheY-like chemotaxis protein